jgi:Domain of unknown function (DUF4402)
MIRTLLCALAFAALAGQVQAQSRSAVSALTIERPLQVSTVRPLTFGPSQVDGSIAAPTGPTEAVIQVTGDPGRIYRVRLPAAIATGVPGATIDGFTIWSDTSGDISQTLTAKMDNTGHDRLRIGGSLRRSGTLVLTEVVAALPLSVDYE